jgi:hypothetical protein
MSNSRIVSIIFFLFFGFMVCLPQSLSAQFITIARKIKTIQNENKEGAKVILDAGASAVYRAIIDTLNSVSNIEISKKDNVKKLVEFSTGENAISMQVDSLATGLSQITVLAVQTGNSSRKPTEAAVNAILAVCHKIGINCTLQEP